MSVGRSGRIGLRAVVVPGGRILGSGSSPSSGTGSTSQSLIIPNESGVLLGQPEFSPDWLAALLHSSLDAIGVKRGPRPGRGAFPRVLLLEPLSHTGSSLGTLDLGSTGDNGKLGHFLHPAPSGLILQ